MKYLPSNDFVPFAPHNVGDQVKIKHQNCDNGVPDHKPRLYIKREHDKIIAFCHNCQCKGTFKEGKDTYRNIHQLITGDSEVGTISKKSTELPDDFTTDIDTWPVQAQAWLYKFDLTKEEINYYGFGFSPYFNRVIIPCYTTTGTLQFWQGRSLDTTNNPPKYLNYTGSKKGVNFYAATHDKFIRDTVVIVEDVVSAIKVGRHMDACAMLGVHVDQVSLLELCDRYKDIVLFSDDDNPTVKLRMMNLKRDLSLICDGTVTIVHSKGVDPKDMEDEDLIKSLENF